MSSSNSFYKDDLYQIFNIIQSSFITYPKEVIISVLKDFFSKSSYYHYSKDQWGFNFVTNHTNLAPGADLSSGFGAHPELSPTENLATRVFIGEAFHQDKIHYPSILIRGGSTKYVPISINRNKGTVQYENLVYQDGYGNQSYIQRPVSFVTAGAFEGSLSIEVHSRSLRARDDLVQLIMMALTEIYFESLVDIGIVIKPINISPPVEVDDRFDKLFKQTLNLDIRTEWRREIPIKTLIDSIVFSIEFLNIDNPNAIPAHNLTITTEVDLDDLIFNNIPNE